MTALNAKLHRKKKSKMTKKRKMKKRLRCPLTGPNRLLRVGCGANNQVL